MRLTDIQIRDIRSLSNVSLQPEPGVNFLIGPNGSGKTSFLEAIHILSLGRSFRTRKAGTVIRTGASALTVFGRVGSEQGEADSLIGIEKTAGHTRIRIDGEEVRSVSSLARRLPVMIITPDGFKALLEGSEHRRRLLDWTLFHVEPDYLEVLQRYTRVLRQRNAMLRSPEGRECDRELEGWEEQLAASGEHLDAMRREHIESGAMTRALEEMMEALHDQGTTHGYWPGWDRSRGLRELLVQQRKRDRQLGFTTAGPHRADIVWRNTRGMARENLSRGQGRLLVVAFELAQVAYVMEKTGEKPVLLVDELGTELDIANMERFLAKIGALGLQAFITSALDPVKTLIPPGNAMRLFHVKQGEIR